MTTFPVATSILSTEALGSFVQQKYVFDAATRCTLLKTGINHTYLVESSKAKYVLRTYYYLWRSREAIAEELALLLELKEKGVAVSFPIPDKDAVLINRIPLGSAWGVA